MIVKIVCHKNYVEQRTYRENRYYQKLSWLTTTQHFSSSARLLRGAWRWRELRGTAGGDMLEYGERLVQGNLPGGPQLRLLTIPG